MGNVVDLSTVLSRATVTSKQWCVYSHQIEGRAFYIGMGNLRRPYETRARSEEWKSFVATLSLFEVVIHLWTDDRLEAVRVESDLIRAYGPECNQTLKRGSTPSPRLAREPTIRHEKTINQPVVRCVEDGKEYESLEGAALSRGFSVALLKRHLLGEVPHIRGRTFVWLGLVRKRHRFKQSPIMQPIWAWEGESEWPVIGPTKLVKRSRHRVVRVAVASASDRELKNAGYVLR